MSITEHSHILSHDLLYILQLFLHPISIPARLGIIILLNPQLNNPIKLNKIVTALNRLQPRRQIMRPKQRFGLVKESRANRLQKYIGQFWGVFQFGD